MLWTKTCAETFKNWVDLNSTHAHVNQYTQQPENQETCEVNYRFDRISNLYQSVFEMRYVYFGKLRCCVVNSVEYIYFISEKSWFISACV